MSRCRSYAPFIVSPNILRAQIEAQGPQSAPPWLPGGLILSIRGFLPVQQQTPPSQRDITPSQREIPAFATRDSRFCNERSHLRSSAGSSQRGIPAFATRDPAFAMRDPAFAARIRWLPWISNLERTCPNWGSKTLLLSLQLGVLMKIYYFLMAILPAVAVFQYKASKPRTLK